MSALIVSENEPLSARLRDGLSRQGYECPTAHVVAPELAGNYLNQLKPELVIVVLSPDPGRGLGVLGELHGRTQAPLLAVGPTADAKLVLLALRAGGREYLDEDDLEAELAGGLRRLQDSGAGRRAGKVLAVLRPSGGCGASTVAVNLAASLAREHQRCLLVDFEVEGGDLATLLDLKPTFTLADLCQHAGQLDRGLLQRSLVAHASGAHLLAPPHALADVGYVSAEGVRQVLSLAVGLFPHAVLDLGRGQREEQEQALRQSDLVVVVLRLDFTCLRNSRRALEHLGNLGIPPDRVRLVVNRAGLPREVPVAKAEQALGAKVFFSLPDDSKAVNQANNNGVPVVLDSPTSKVGRALAQLAQALDRAVS